ncbi:MAG: hypothetical protein ACLRR3_01155 [Eubacterium sp.]
MINRTLFISVRKNGELEGNAKALYPYVKGDKVIFAKQLPHNPLQILKAVKLICTSKVIVTDDYVKYLRYFDLKPEQELYSCGMPVEHLRSLDREEQIWKLRQT